MKKVSIVYILFCLLLSACSGANNPLNPNRFSDGEYCAEVEYYNPNTGTRSVYTLNVEVEENSVVVLYWPNGGHLDDDHFSPELLDEDGICSFISDKGYEYTVEIMGDPCSFPDVDRMQEELVCPKCGDEKDDYDDLCEDCQDEKDDREENTCHTCGNYEYGMYDNRCSYCEDKEENTCSRCGGIEYGVYGGLCDDCQDDEY